ncbi:MAG TPA: hypothetical protein VGN88_13545 [Phycisphaerae bacterium]|jgi:hypothetical protein
MTIPDSITFTVPLPLLRDIAELSSELTIGMHQLLEKQTAGLLSNLEQAQLDALVRIAEFGQIVNLALEPKDAE